MRKLGKISGLLILPVLLVSTFAGVVEASGLVVEPQMRTVFTSQALPVMIYTEPVVTAGDTTDVDVTITITEASLTSIKKITLAPKVSRKEASSVQLIPATASTPAKRIITERLTYAGKIKAKKLMMTVYLKALYAGEFSVSGGPSTGSYTIQGTTRTQPELGDADADVTPAPVVPSSTAVPSVAPSTVAEVGSSLSPALPSAFADGDVLATTTDETEQSCAPTSEQNESEKPNYLLWIIMWILSLLLILFVGYFVGKRECGVRE